MRKLLAASLLSLSLLGTYAAADVLDIAPGILTRQQPTPLPATATPSGPSPTLAPLPTPAGEGAVLAALPGDAPVPTAAGLRTALGPALAQAALGPSVGVSIRDARTGSQLLSIGAEKPRVVASTAKILTAAAVTQTLDLDAVMTTRLVRSGPTELTVIAAGDTLLARGAGDSGEVAGHAGLGDLAEQAAAALTAAGEDDAAFTVRIDASYAAGERYPAGWNMADVAAGYTQGVSMIGLAAQRPKPGEPSPTDPEAEAVTALAEQLAKHGITAKPDTGQDGRLRPAPADAPLLASADSAPYREVLAIALDESDNALTENLARQAAIKAGGDGSFAANAAYVTSELKKLGLDLSGTHLLDTSGLSRGQTATVALLSAVVAKARAGDLPGLDDLLARLPVAGLDGTLYDRFREAPADAAAGIARAKTGTLTGISGLLGTTVTADEREIDFVIIADAVPPTSGTWAARIALDRFVADLTACGCR